MTRARTVICQLHCDVSGCPATFAQESGETTPALRERAQAAHWLHVRVYDIENVSALGPPHPGKTRDEDSRLDICPSHTEIVGLRARTLVRRQEERVVIRAMEKEGYKSSVIADRLGIPRRRVYAVAHRPRNKGP